MTIGHKQVFLAMLYMGGGLLILGLLATHRVPQEVALLLILGWFLLCGTLQWAVLRCPRCGKSAFYVRKRVYTGFVGEGCRKCGYRW